jgi:methylase of polypeptide subunit release factors
MPIDTRGAPPRGSRPRSQAGSSASVVDPVPDAALPDVERLKAVFERHGYAGPAAREALGAELGPSYLRLDLPLYLRRLAEPRPLHTLIKLFGLFEPVCERDAEAAFLPLGLEAVAAMGLVERRGSEVHARVGLSAFEGLLLAHDRYDASEPALQRDHVLGVNPATATLAFLTLRRPARRALDMGCGNGVQALLAARHCEHVTGVDLNPRALAFARFNARLNGVANVEWLEGDLFEPVAGKRFDLVVSNPPFVISPDSTYTFRDGGRRGDGLSADVATRAAEHLAEAGFATVLANWVLAPGEDVAAPPRRWLEGRGCDTWVIANEPQAPLTYAAVWNRSRDRGTYAAALDRWCASYAEQGIAALVIGALAMRRRSGPRHWLRVSSLPAPPAASADATLRRVFANEDRLGELTDAGLLDTTLRVVAEHSIEQRLAFRDGDYRLEAVDAELAGGLRFRGRLDAGALQLMRRCDGQRSLREIVAELEQVAPGALDGASLLEVVRRLAALGFVEVVGLAPRA